MWVIVVGERQLGQAQPRRPPRGALQERLHVARGEIEADQELDRLLERKREVRSADLEDPAVCAKPLKPYRWITPRGEYEPETRRSVLEQPVKVFHRD